MLEYSVALGNDLRDVWAGQILPLMDQIRDSSLFWPGVVAAGVVLLLVVKRPTR
jgi:hypothetical protein